MEIDNLLLRRLKTGVSIIKKQYVKLLVLLFTVSACQTALGQPSVTDVDLKSMYCVRVNLDARKALDATIQHFQLKIPNSKPLQDLKNHLANIDTNINRLRSYIMVRSRIVDPTIYSQSLAVAAKRADEDLAASSKCTNSCGDTTGQNGYPNFEKLDRCISSCKKQISAVLSRIESCNVINWLPF